MVTLEAVRAAAGPYPTRVLEGCESALVLFAAGFAGRQDAIHIADAGLTATCVDTNHQRLGDMILAYPEGWEYVYADAFRYAQETFRQWDVVSLDPYTNLIQRCADLLPLWMELACHAVILGVVADTVVTLPEGWKQEETVRRSRNNGGTYWAVFERC